MNTRGYNVVNYTGQDIEVDGKTVPATAHAQVVESAVARCGKDVQPYPYRDTEPTPKAPKGTLYVVTADVATLMTHFRSDVVSVESL